MAEGAIAEAGVWGSMLSVKQDTRARGKVRLTLSLQLISMITRSRRLAFSSGSRTFSDSHHFPHRLLTSPQRARLPPHEPLENVFVLQHFIYVGLCSNLLPGNSAWDNSLSLGRALGSIACTRASHPWSVKLQAHLSPDIRNLSFLRHGTFWFADQNPLFFRENKHTDFVKIVNAETNA